VEGRGGGEGWRGGEAWRRGLEEAFQRTYGVAADDRKVHEEEEELVVQLAREVVEAPTRVRRPAVFKHMM
jgi:hypothetical protein